LDIFDQIFIVAIKIRNFANTIFIATIKIWFLKNLAILAACAFGSLKTTKKTVSPLTIFSKNQG